jgi:hypothetical protein
MIQLITWVASHSDQIIGALTSIVTGASALAALTPTPKDDTFIGKLYKVIDFLALNIGKAKDSGKKDETQK